MSNYTRFVVCEIVGDGDPDVPYGPGVGAFRAATEDIVAGYNLIKGSQKLNSLNGVMPDTDENGAYIIARAFVLIGADDPADFAPLEDSSLCTVFPEASPDIRVSAIGANDIAALTSALTTAGFDTSTFSTVDTFEDLVIVIGDQVTTSFQISNFPT